MLKINIKKIITIVFAFVMTISIMKIDTFASDYTCTLSIELSKSQIKVGESVVLSIRVSNINAGEGIAIYNSIIEYDNEIFDISINADEENKWIPSLIENSITFTKANYEATDEDQEIGKIILTAKEGAEL